MPLPGARPKCGMALEPELQRNSVAQEFEDRITVDACRPLINDIFSSHLYVDHFADLPYMYPFARAHGAKDSRVRTSMLSRGAASVGACGFTKAPWAVHFARSSALSKTLSSNASSRVMLEK